MSIGGGPLKALDAIHIATARDNTPAAANAPTYHHETPGMKIRMKAMAHETSQTMKNFIPRTICGGRARAKSTSGAMEGFSTGLSLGSSEPAARSRSAYGHLRRVAV